MAINTYGIYLMHGTGTETVTYAKLVDIKSVPSLLGERNELETTTLSDDAETFILGIRRTGKLTFTINYDNTEIDALRELEGKEEHYAVYVGHDVSGVPDGHEGKYTFDGYLGVSTNEGGVDEVLEATVSIAPSTVITKATAA
ncbi:MAG: phage tail protein [Ruminococcus sp.]|nr:phage tail protein [Ruminococcus sp.]MBR1752923.1 phage tail protein [Ruminococcus sp.]